MKKFQDKYRIPSTRLKNWDYGSHGLYFVTICTYNRQCYFGEIVETQNLASLRPTPIGTIAIQYWKEIPGHFPFVELDEFTIMPNHIHGILFIKRPNYNNWQPNKFGPQSKNLGSIIRGYKSSVKTFATKNNIEFKWQARFYDHIIRDEKGLMRIRQYIFDNPRNWDSDKDNQANLKM